MEELILICEDSVEGILTAIYRIYEWKLCGKRVKIQTGASDLCLFAQYREVMPDAECAAKVARTLRRRFGEQAWEAISYALASEEADKSQAVYETIAAGLSGRIRGPLLQALAEPCIHRVFALSRSVHRVRERVLQFLRFQEITGGILYGEIAPDADVLAFVMPHFADRFPLENFVILDERRAAAGIHPGDVKDASADYQEQLEQLIKQPKVVAVGEIGLDYHYEDNAPRDVQIAFFKTQLQLANQYQLPVIIHDREAHADTMDLLKKYKPKGVVHCFSGSVEMAKEVIKLGMYVGLGGAVTFKNAKTPVAVAASIPLESMVLETDAPYMTPVPFRGKRCDSSMIIYTAEKIANARSEQGNIITAEELLRITRQNASNLFGVPLED